MSGWLDRFENDMITVADLCRLDHRTRVAWAYYGVSAVTAHMSGYFMSKSGLSLALRMAEAFITDGVIDGVQIADARSQLLAASEQLEMEGHEKDEFVMAASLLSAIRDKSHLPQGRIVHTSCDAVCEKTPSACEWCHSSTGVVYTIVTQWIRGIGACKLPDASLDDIMAQFFQFGKEVYMALAIDPPSPLPLRELPGLALSWELPGPIEAEMIRTAWKAPPMHEGK